MTNEVLLTNLIICSLVVKVRQNQRFERYKNKNRKKSAKRMAKNKNRETSLLMYF